MSTERERILLVESDPVVGDLIARQTLKPLGYQVEVVKVASSAIQVAVRFSPDIIIVNLDLPGLSGKDLLVALASQGVDTPVIVLAGTGMEGDVIQSFRLGAFDYLGLPVREAEVVSAVERAFKQVRAKREREQLALQLEKTNQELERRVRELTTIFAMGKAVTSITDQNALFEKIVEGAVYVAEADFGYLLLRKDKSKKFVLSAHRNLPKMVTLRMSKSWDDGISSLVAMSGESFAIHGEPLNRFKVSQLGKSALVVPVKVQQQVVGLLVVVRKEDKPFSKSNQTMLEAVSDYASISLVNVRLFQALESRAHSLQRTIKSTQESERIKAEVLKNVSDELKKPLDAMGEHVDILVNSDADRLNAEQRETLQRIQLTMFELTRVVEALTSLKEASSPKDIKTINLVNLARKAVDRWQKAGKERGLEFHTHFVDEALFVKVDPGLVDRIFDALLSNAVKFSVRDGHINVSIERSGENQVHVMVEDDGLGIPKEDLPHIFDPFYQVDTAEARELGGLGMGLSLAKESVNKHGGEMWADSQLSLGSIFHFTLPLAESGG
jgi:signal transduction histidine kinase/FixJ family two-component response regulator